MVVFLVSERKPQLTLNINPQLVWFFRGFCEGPSHSIDAGEIEFPAVGRLIAF